MCSTSSLISPSLIDKWMGYGFQWNVVLEQIGAEFSQKDHHCLQMLNLFLFHLFPQPYNRQNTYQRTISNDSKANSSCSDETGQTSSGKE